MNIFWVLLHISNAAALFWRQASQDEAMLDGSSSFVDKTLLIEKYFEETKTSKYQVITSPRGFGKTTIAYMLRRFVQVEVDEFGNVKNKSDTSAYKLFTDKRLKISNHHDVIKDHLAEYPVIHFDYTDVTEESSILTERKLVNKISKTFKRYKWLYTILTKKYAQRRDAKETELAKKVSAMGKIISEHRHLYIPDLLYALCQLAELLYEHFQRKIFLIVDDYDSMWLDGLRHNDPFQMGYADWLHDIINLLFLPEFSKYIEYVFITGTHTITLNQTFVYNRFLGDHPFADYYGFTKEDVLRLLDQNKIHQADIQQLQNLHNGYTTKATKLQIFQSSAIIEHLHPSKKTTPAPIIRSSPIKKRPLKEWIDGDSLSLLRIALVNKEINEQIKLVVSQGNATFKLQPKINQRQLQALSYNIRDIAGTKRNLKPEDQIESLTVDWFFTLLFENGYFTYTQEPDCFKVSNERKMNSLKAFSVLE